MTTYTCSGKGGGYILVGEASGAGTMRDGLKIAVYRDAKTGLLFYRTAEDFIDRMRMVQFSPDSYDLADALYNRGYRDARKELDQDARACDEWQAVVDAIDSQHDEPL